MGILLLGFLNACNRSSQAATGASVKDDYIETRKTFREVFDRAAKFNPQSPRLMFNLKGLGKAYETKDFLDRAILLFNRASAKINSSQNPNEEEVIDHLTDLAKAYEMRGDFAKAEPLYKRVLTIHDQHHDADDLVLASGLNNLARNYKEQGDLARAEPLFKRALDIFMKQLDFGNSQVVSCRNSLAELYAIQGRLEEAASLVSWEESFAAGVRGILEIKHLNKMYFHIALKKAEAFGSLDPRFLFTLKYLGKAYQSEGNPQSELIFKAVLTLLESKQDTDDFDLADGLTDLALVYEGKGNFLQAEHLYKRALIILENHQDLDLDLVENLTDLARVYAKQDHLLEAEPLFSRVLSILRMRAREIALFYPIDTEFSYLYTLNYIAHQGFPEAEQLFNEGLSVIRKDGFVVMYGSFLKEYANLLSTQKRYKEMEKVIRQFSRLKVEIKGSKNIGGL